MDPHSVCSYEVVSIPVDAIRHREWTLVERLTETSIDEMASSMSVFGLMQPIRVSAHDENGYNLVFGARRLAAARRLAWPTIAAYVCEWDDSQCAAAALVENVQYKPLSFLQMSLAIEAGISLRHLTRSSLPNILGKSQNFVTSIAKLADFGMDVQLMLHAAPWTIWCATKIDRVIDPDRRDLLIRNAIAHALTAEQVEAESHEPPDSNFVLRNGILHTIGDPLTEHSIRRISESNTMGIDTESIGEPDPREPIFNNQSHLGFLMTELMRVTPNFEVPESLDEQIDLIAVLRDTIAHLLYVFRLTTPTMRPSDMIQDAMDRASTLPFEWFG